MIGGGKGSEAMQSDPAGAATRERRRGWEMGAGRGEMGMKMGIGMGMRIGT